MSVTKTSLTVTTRGWGDGLSRGAVLSDGTQILKGRPGSGIARRPDGSVDHLVVINDTIYISNS